MVVYKNVALTIAATKLFRYKYYFKKFLKACHCNVALLDLKASLLHSIETQTTTTFPKNPVTIYRAPPKIPEENCEDIRNTFLP